MGARFALDASSFEKLLAAAWVLQCQQDEKKKITMKQLDQSGALVQSDTSEAVVDPAWRIEEKACRAPEAAAVVTEPLPPLPMDSAVLLPAVEKSKDVSAAPVPRNAISVCNPALITALHAMATAAEDQAMAEISRWFSVILLTVQSRWLHRKTVRLVVSKRSMRLARVSIAPILLLFVMFAFSASQVWKQKAAQASQRADLQAPQSALGDTLQAHQMRVAESLMAPDQVRNARLTAQLPSSHLRITDSTTASAVQALSPYEIEGLRRQAEYGDSSAALALGMAYETGQSVHQSCTKAAEWVAFAAANDSPAAEYNLGL
ncbi:MAG TPA: hypothetical protein VEI49_11870, partial [Terriglobales bacterium]|nr:hypothetical protein [Terriglobales bacterium]